MYRPNIPCIIGYVYRRTPATMWNGGQVSSSSYYSNVAEESVSSVLMPDVCGETQQKMDFTFQTTSSDLSACGSQLKDLYTTRGELADKLQFIDLEIYRAEDEQRKAKKAKAKAKKANHFPIHLDATNWDLKPTLGMDFTSLQDACLCGPLSPSQAALSVTCSPDFCLSSMLLSTTLLVRLLPQLLSTTTTTATVRLLPRLLSAPQLAGSPQLPDLWSAGPSGSSLRCCPSAMPSSLMPSMPDTTTTTCPLRVSGPSRSRGL